MAFLGQVGDTFTLRDNPPYKNLYVILTNPNEDGQVVVVSFTKPLKMVQSYIILTPKHDGELFKYNTTVRYTDADLRDQKRLVDYIAEHADRAKKACPLDIIREIVTCAFKAKQSPIKVLEELARQYPDCVI